MTFNRFNCILASVIAILLTKNNDVLHRMELSELVLIRQLMRYLCHVVTRSTGGESGDFFKAKGMKKGCKRKKGTKWHSGLVNETGPRASQEVM